MQARRLWFTIALLVMSARCLQGDARTDEGIRILSLAPTPLFPKTAPGEPLRQVARLKLDNGGPAVEARVKITVVGSSTAPGLALFGHCTSCPTRPEPVYPCTLCSPAPD